MTAAPGIVRIVATLTSVGQEPQDTAVTEGEARG